MNKRKFIQYVAASALGSVYLPGHAQQSNRDHIYSLAGLDINTKSINLNDFVGKVCLVSFFTAGCNLCSHDLKLMREFYVGNRTRNFVLLGVNIDSSKEDFTQYMHLIELSVPVDQRFPIVWRNAPGHKDTFGTVTKKPTHFVLDKTHKLTLRREGVFQPGDWDNLWSALT
jgi:peroxiredoxin